MFTEFFQNMRACAQNPNVGHNLRRMGISLIKNRIVVGSVTLVGGILTSSLSYFSIHPLTAAVVIGVPLVIVYKDQILKLCIDVFKSFADEQTSQTIKQAGSEQGHPALTPELLKKLQELDAMPHQASRKILKPEAQNNSDISQSQLQPLSSPSGSSDSDRVAFVKKRAIY